MVRARALVRDKTWTRRQRPERIVSVALGLDRRLVAVMFTDMVGYTALLQADERSPSKARRATGARSRRTTRLRRDDRPAARRREHEHVPELARRGRRPRSRSSRSSAPGGPARIGVHVGEVIVEPERLTGDAVNIAARIESFAVPGGVMVSDAAYDQIRNRPDVELVALGRFRLKNVGRPFELYAVSADGVVVPDPPRSRARASGSRACRATCPARRRRSSGGRRPGVAHRPRAGAAGRHDHGPRRSREDARR